MGSNLGGIRWRIEGPGCAGENSDICAAVAPLPITGLGPILAVRPNSPARSSPTSCIVSLYA